MSKTMWVEKTLRLDLRKRFKKTNLLWQYYANYFITLFPGRPKVVSTPKTKKKAKADSGSDYEDEEEKKSRGGKKGKMPKGTRSVTELFRITAST